MPEVTVDLLTVSLSAVFQVTRFWGIVPSWDILFQRFQIQVGCRWRENRKTGTKKMERLGIVEGSRQKGTFKTANMVQDILDISTKWHPRFRPQSFILTVLLIASSAWPLTIWSAWFELLPMEIAFGGNVLKMEAECVKSSVQYYFPLVYYLISCFFFLP